MPTNINQQSGLEHVCVEESVRNWYSRSRRQGCKIDCRIFVNSAVNL